MANKIAAAALQYSKWLSRFICWVWALYRFSVLFASACVPDAAEALVATIPGIDTIMLFNISTYMVNSLGEKWIYSDKFMLRWLDKGGFKSLIGNIAGKILKDKQNTEDNPEEESDNG